MEKIRRRVIGRRLATAVGLIWLSTITATGVFAQAVDGQPAGAQAASGAPAAAAAPATPAPTFVGPAITGPIQGLPPFEMEAGALGKIQVNGILDGMGLAQSNHIPGDDSTQAALSNGQVFITEPNGPVQFYLQAGAYNLPALGFPFLATDKTMSALYGPIPLAYVKLAPSGKAWKNTSILIGELPTLIGAETTFTFENMNVERGLLWGQETAVSRGIQLNQTMGKFMLSFSWNDGFYSNRYNWLSGMLMYTNGPHSLSFVAGGNAGNTDYGTSAAPPLQNNSSIYNVIYTYTKGSWIIQPYWQYTHVPVNASIGLTKATSTQGGALLISRSFKKGFSLAGRVEDIASSGSVADGSANLLGYGPGSSAFSITGTPTFQYGAFFVRGDISWVRAGSYLAGDVFGALGTKQNQARAMAEIGFIVGKTEK